jgi:hypothetical protein
MAMSNMLYRKYIPLALTTIAGVSMLLEYFFNVPLFATLAVSFRSISSKSVGVGHIAANGLLFLWNYRKIQQAQTPIDKGIAGTTLVVSAIYLILGFGLGQPSIPYKGLSEWTWSGISYGVIMSYPFWLLWAAYRALRVRTLEGLGLLVAAFVVILSMAPWSYIYIWPGFEQVNPWLSDNFSQPAMSAILMGAGIGGAAAAIRTLLWKEKMLMRGTA